MRHFHPRNLVIAASRRDAFNPQYEPDRLNESSALVNAAKTRQVRAPALRLYRELRAEGATYRLGLETRSCDAFR